MRNKIIDFFIDDPEQVPTSQELLFYAIMASPLFIALAVIIITL